MTGKNRGLAFVGACAALTTLGVLTYGRVSQGAAPHAGNLSKKDKVAYTIGYRIGQSFKQQDVDVDPAVVAQGMRAGMGKAKAKLSEKQMQQVMLAFRQKMMQQALAKRQAEAQTNAKTSAAFLKANAKKPGVHVTKSGLQYKVLKKGHGQSPKASDTVEVNYKGMLPNGKKFDASADHGDGGPATFEADHVIPGWTEALQMMKPGAKWRIWIPAKLAYGAQGTRSGVIGPNQALVFDVELVKVVKSGKSTNAGSSSANK